MQKAGFLRKKGADFYLNIFLLAVYLTLHIILALNHEAWRDEAHAWIIARNTGWHGLWEMCSSDGHPILWFLILKALSSLGFSFYYFSLVSVCIMTGAAALMLFKGSFSRVMKIFLLLSPIFFYYNPVICRNYSLATIMCCAVCAYWPKRREKPVRYGILVALLFQTHILISGLAIGSLAEMVLFDRDRLKKKHLIGIGLAFLSMILFVLELKQNSTTETYYHLDLGFLLSKLSLEGLSSALEALGAQFVYTPGDIGSYVDFSQRSGTVHAGDVFLPLMGAMLVIFLLFFIFSRKARTLTKEVLVANIFGVLVFFGIGTMVRPVEHIQMGIVFWTIMLHFLWLNQYNRKALREAPEGEAAKAGGGKAALRFLRAYVYEILMIGCILSVLPQCVLADPIADLKYPYSGGREVVEKTKDIVSDGAAIALRETELAPTVAAFLYDCGKHYTLWDLDHNCEFGIHKFGRPINSRIDNTNLVEYIRKQLAGYTEVWYLDGNYDYRELEPMPEELTLMAENPDPTLWNEYFHLFRVDMTQK